MKYDMGLLHVYPARLYDFVKQKTSGLVSRSLPSIWNKKRKPSLAFFLHHFLYVDLLFYMLDYVVNFTIQNKAQSIKRFCADILPVFYTVYGICRKTLFIYQIVFGFAFGQ